MSELDNRILLDGNGWRMNYFRPELKPRENVVFISRIGMPDGVTAGAHMPGYDDSSWWNGTVPGDVRTILMENEEMEDPFVARNSDKSRWVEEYEWWFRKDFTLPAAWADRRIQLSFAGVDLKASYWLNGTLLGSSNDMFVPSVFDVTDIVSRHGRNVLAVRLSPPPASDSNHYPGGRIPDRARHHKCQCSWGWDWARELVTIGIWDSVELKSHGPVQVKDVFVQAVPEDGGASALVELEVTVAGTKAGLPCSIDVTLLDPLGKVAGRISKDLAPASGGRKVKFLHRLDNPYLWWPNGYGSQGLYTCRVSASADGIESDSYSTSFGVRSISMARNPGSPEEAYPLTFCVNGRQIFVRGANWAPADLLFGRLREQDYEPLVKLARDIGFNMFRVWGGGLVEKDCFYRLCDRYGILVWQEFPLSCASYPRSKKFTAEKKREADAVIKKLRNHPSTALYCGGNELFYYGESSGSPVLQAFKESVGRLHPMIGYHYSSPDKERPGERHHGPWVYQKENHAFWNGHKRLFASEVGCNAMPVKRTIDQVIPKTESWPDGPSFHHHFMPCVPFGAGGCYYGTSVFGSDGTLEEEIFYSQLVQADSLRYTYGHYRANSPESSGVLLWGFNGSWPDGAWGIVDYYGRQKMACHFLREVCSPVCMHVKDNGWELKGGMSLDTEVFLINQSWDMVPDARLEISLISDGGGELVHALHVNSLGADNVSDPVVIKIPLENMRGEVLILNISWVAEGKVISSTSRWYARDEWRSMGREAREFLHGCVVSQLPAEERPGVACKV